MASLTKSRPDVAAAVQRLSARKSDARPRFVPAQAVDNSPTPERVAKGDYEWRGNKRVKANTLQALRKAGDISSEAETAAGRWIEDYVLSWSGHLDAMKDPLPPEYVKGDVHTFAISRGKAAERIGMIRDRLGNAAHCRLEMMLAKEMSFSKMGELIYPELSQTVSRTKISAQCGLILEQLPSTYADVRREIKSRIDRNAQKRLVPACAP